MGGAPWRPYRTMAAAMVGVVFLLTLARGTAYFRVITIPTFSSREKGGHYLFDGCQDTPVRYLPIGSYSTVAGLERRYG